MAIDENCLDICPHFKKTAELPRVTSLKSLKEQVGFFCFWGAARKDRIL